MTFALDPRLAADTFHIGDLSLSRVLLMNEQRYAWLLLVPMRDGMADIADLSEPDSKLLMTEIREASAALRKIVAPLKFNVAALGNRVRQLHVHIIARHEGDAAWPGVVWDKGAPHPYAPGEADKRVSALRQAFGAALAL